MIPVRQVSSGAQLAGMPLNYAKWDNLEDSDEEEERFSGGVNRPNQPSPHASQDKQTAQVAPNFIVRTTALASGCHSKRPAYINVCSSTAVPGSMSAAPSSMRGLDASFPYIVGDVREDEDKEGACFVVECLFHPDAHSAFAKDKRIGEAMIRTALNVVSEMALPLDKSEWSLFELDELREKNGTFFFAPGRLRNASADDELSGVE